MQSWAAGHPNPCSQHNPVKLGKQFITHHSNLFKLGNSHPPGLIAEDGTLLWVHALGGFSTNAIKNENYITPDGLC